MEQKIFWLFTSADGDIQAKKWAEIYFVIDRWCQITKWCGFTGSTGFTGHGRVVLEMKTKETKGGGKNKR